ncbi:MAG: patatin family protein [Eggerthellaceae bacterium]|nr:patatin family protein [Eggerthellaceae bacterium]MCH4220715.1 patatin family protein [Eggerthellaceae bacterium]
MNDYKSDPHCKPAYTDCGIEPFDLILEGGAMRGLFTAGVLDVFMERHLCAQHVIGTSAGGLTGLNYVAGDHGRSCYLNTKYCTDWHYLSMKSFVHTGNALGIDLMFDKIPNELDPMDYNAFFNSPMILTTVASNLDIGEADYHTYQGVAEELPYLVATASVPLVSKIVTVDDMHLLDGGVCDSVPLMFSLMCGAHKQVIILTQHDGYVKRPNKLMALASTKYSDYPYFVERMAHRHFEYNRIYRRIKRMQAAGDIFVIRPARPVTISSMESDPHKLMDLYNEGRKQAEASWRPLLTYLGLA